MMPRKRKPSTPTFRRPLPFVSSPLQASLRNPPSPFKPSVSPPEARSVPIDDLSETECVILPCSQLTTAPGFRTSKRSSKRRSPRFSTNDGTSGSSVGTTTTTTAAARLRRGRNGSGGGGGKGRRKTPVKNPNKKPVVTVVKGDGGRTILSKRRTNSIENQRMFGIDVIERGESGKIGGDRGRFEEEQRRVNPRRAKASDTFSPDMIEKKRTEGDSMKIVNENLHRNENDRDEENFLHSKNLLITPPSRNRRKKSSDSACGTFPLGEVINTPEIPPPPRGVEEEEVVPDSYPLDADDVKYGDDDAEATFLTPQRRPASSQVLVPETPVAEMGLTHVEKVTMARRRLRQATAAQDAQ